MSQIIHPLKKRAAECFEYREGRLYWKISKRGTKGVGSVAGRFTSRGYLQVHFDGKTYMGHRIIFLLHHGYLPEQVDHINGDTKDNRIENLRAASASQNGQNKKIASNNTSGCKGVNFNKNKNMWMVNLRLHKHRHFLGYYRDKELADLVASSFREKYHGEFCNHGAGSYV